MKTEREALQLIYKEARAQRAHELRNAVRHLTGAVRWRGLAVGFAACLAVFGITMGGGPGHTGDGSTLSR